MSAVVSLPEALIRPMREADLAVALANERAAYEFPWTHGIFRDCLRVGYQCFVREVAGRVISHGIMSVAAQECHLLNICVHPDFQRQGHGRAMIAHLLDIARRKRAVMALLEVRVSNDAAYRLYTSMGFHEVGVRRNYYPARRGREDAIILARDL